MMTKAERELHEALLAACQFGTREWEGADLLMSACLSLCDYADAMEHMIRDDDAEYFRKLAGQLEEKRRLQAKALSLMQRKDSSK